MNEFSISEIKKYPIRGQIKLNDKTIDIPATYIGKGITAVFPISFKEAKKFINSRKIIPTRLSLSKSVVNITVFDFHTSPIGPYTELVYSIPVLYKPKFNIPLIPLLFNKWFKNFGVFVVDIMQSTRDAVNHGNLLTGYPHNNSLINTRFDYTSDGIDVRVLSGSDEILTLHVPSPNGDKKVFQPYMTYFEKADGNAYKIQMDVYGTEQKVGSCGLNIGKDCLADPLRRLNTNPNSLRVMYYPNVTEINPVSLEKI